MHLVIILSQTLKLVALLSFLVIFEIRVGFTIDGILSSTEQYLSGPPAHHIKLKLPAHCQGTVYNPKVPW